MEFNLQDATVDQFRCLWDNNGQWGPEADQRIKLTDALATTNAPMMFPKVISNIVKEAIEPYLVGASLLDRLNYSYGQTITFPAVGAIEAGFVAQGQEYPETQLQTGGATVTASIGKAGIAVKVTEEMVRYSQFDVIGMHLRAAARALARLKETTIFNYIRSMGVPVFDNLTPTNSIFGVTTARNINGQANGGVTMDDVFDTFAQIVTQGFMPNTLLMHPLTWTMFVKDAQLREFVRASGGGTFFASWTGNPAGQAPWGNPNGLGVGVGQTVLPGQTSLGATAPHGQTATALAGYPQNITSAPVLPSYLNVPFRIIVSPFVPFDARRKLTDIYMFDASELGVLVVDHDVMTEEFNDPKVDIMKIKLKERYGIGIKNEGQGIGVMRNVKVVPNEIVLPAQAQLDVSGSLQPIDPGTALAI